MTDGDGVRDVRPETAAVSDDILYPTFDDDALAELAGFGHRRPVAGGKVLYGPGDDPPGFFVVLEGEIEVVRLDEEAKAVIATFTVGQFVGELALLTGQRPQLTTRARSPGWVLTIDRREFRRLMSSRPALADIIFGALVARREFLRAGDAALAVRIIGSRHSRDAMALGLFCFIGAEAATSWLGGPLALDAAGCVFTDRSIRTSVLVDPLFAAPEPLPFETSAPGVFAVGDVRHGSTKRVAAAVGEGSSAVRSVHECLAAHA